MTRGVKRAESGSAKPGLIGLSIQAESGLTKHRAGPGLGGEGTCPPRTGGLGLTGPGRTGFGPGLMDMCKKGRNKQKRVGFRANGSGRGLDK